jgi:hypothetical protein
LRWREEDKTVICLQDEEKDKAKGGGYGGIYTSAKENESPVGQYFALCLAEGSLLTSNIKKRCGRSKLTENDK